MSKSLGQEYNGLLTAISETFSQWQANAEYGKQFLKYISDVHRDEVVELTAVARSEESVKWHG